MLSSRPPFLASDPSRVAGMLTKRVLDATRSSVSGTPDLSTACARIILFKEAFCLTQHAADGNVVSFHLLPCRVRLELCQ